MARTICNSKPESRPGFPEVIVLDARANSEKWRNQMVHLGRGHLYIPANTILTNELIQWVRYLEDMLSWRIYGPSDQLNRLGASARPESG